MKIKINDKSKVLRFSFGVAIVALILALALPHILNIAFGNSISSEIISVTSDVVSEIDVGIAEGKFILYNSQGMKKYNSKGEFESEYYKSAFSPILHIKGNYAVLSDTTSTEFTVLKGDNLKYEIKAPQNVKSVSVNSKGYTTIITGETGYKSLVIVYNNKGIEKYRWYSDEGYAVDAQLSDNCKLLAVASIKMDGNKLITVVEQYKLNKESAISRVTLDNIIPYNVAFNGSKVVLIGDKKAYSITRGGKINGEYDYKGRVLECFDAENINNITLALSEGAVATEVVVLNEKLKQKGAKRCEFLVTMLDENKGKAVIAGEGNVKIITDKGNVLTEGTLSKDGSFIVLGDNWRKFAVYSSGYINLFKVQRGR